MIALGLVLKVILELLLYIERWREYVQNLEATVGPFGSRIIPNWNIPCSSLLSSSHSTQGAFDIAVPSSMQEVC